MRSDTEADNINKDGAGGSGNGCTFRLARHSELKAAAGFPLPPLKRHQESRSRLIQNGITKCSVGIKY